MKKQKDIIVEQPPPICIYCRLAIQGGKCKAFLQGIPDDIMFNKADHRQRHEGDAGYRFDPIDEQAAQYAATLFGD